MFTELNRGGGREFHVKWNFGFEMRLIVPESWEGANNYGERAFIPNANRFGSGEFKNY
jgi:hypothetical protein